MKLTKQNVGHAGGMKGHLQWVKTKRATPVLFMFYHVIHFSNWS